MPNQVLGLRNRFASKSVPPESSKNQAPAENSKKLVNEAREKLIKELQRKPSYFIPHLGDLSSAVLGLLRGKLIWDPTAVSNRINKLNFLEEELSIPSINSVNKKKNVKRKKNLK